MENTGLLRVRPGAGENDFFSCNFDHFVISPRFFGFWFLPYMPRQVPGCQPRSTWYRTQSPHDSHRIYGHCCEDTRCTVYDPTVRLVYDYVQPYSNSAC